MFSLAYYCYLPTTDSLIALDKSQRFSAKEQTSMNSMLAMVLPFVFQYLFSLIFVILLTCIAKIKLI